MKLKKIMTFGLAAAMAVSMTAFGAVESKAEEAPAMNVKGANEDPANTEVTDEILHIGLSSEPSTLWGAPSGKLENEEAILSNALRDRLVQYDATTGEAYPGLAAEWEWLDETHCRFTLRDDVIMTDGTPLVADDVVYSVGIWKEYSPNNDTGKYFVGATAEDEHTVTIEYNVIAPDLVTMMANSNYGIVSEDEVNAAGGLEEVQTNPLIGCGRYKFKEWKRGQSITVERNEDYWDPDYKGYFKEIVFTFTNDPAARVMAVESGDTDVAISVPISQTSVYAANENLSAIIYSSGQVSHLWYNMGEKAGATKDINVRKAIDKALNFEAIAQVGTSGLGTQALGYTDPSSKYYTQTWTEEERAVDIEGAKALLEEAGYGDGLELNAVTLDQTLPVFTVMQANLAEAGIKLNIETPDTAQFVERAFAGDYDIILVGDNVTVKLPTIIPSLAKGQEDGTGMAIGGAKWSTKEIVDMISKLIAEPDTEKAKEELKWIDETVKENMVASHLYTEMYGVVTGSDIKGFCQKASGYMDPTTFYK